MKKYTLDARVVVLADDLDSAFEKFSKGFLDMRDTADSDLFCPGTEINIKIAVTKEADKWIRKLEEAVERRDREMFEEGFKKRGEV